jgi:hypothetical protein
MIPVTADCATRLPMPPKERSSMKSSSKPAQRQIRVNEITELSEDSLKDDVENSAIMQARLRLPER